VRRGRCQKRRRCSSRLKSRDVSLYCRVSLQPRAVPSVPSVPPDGGHGARAACLEAQAPIASPAARHGAFGAYPRPTPPQPGQLRQASHDRGVECAWPSGWPAPRRASDAPEQHSSCSNAEVQANDRQRPRLQHCALSPATSFTARGPNQKWAGDITCVWTREGWVALAVILDLFSRRVIGWAISNPIKQDWHSGP